MSNACPPDQPYRLDAPTGCFFSQEGIAVFNEIIVEDIHVARYSCWCKMLIPTKKTCLSCETDERSPMHASELACSVFCVAHLLAHWWGSGELHRGDPFGQRHFDYCIGFPVHALGALAAMLGQRQAEGGSPSNVSLRVCSIARVWPISSSVETLSTVLG